jgi:signal transduction histidine kinase/DNA-binding response OmpR family regulator
MPKSDAISTVESLAKFPDENPHPVMRIARDGVLMYANEPSEPLTTMWSVGIGESVPHAVKAAIDAAVLKDMPFEYEVQCGAREYSLMLAPVPDEIYVNVYGRDVTEQRDAESKVSDLAKFPDENPNPVVRVRYNGLVLYANVAAEPLLRHWGTVAGGKVPKELATRLDACLQSGRDFDVQMQCGPRVYGVQWAPVIGRGYVNAYAKDITLRLEAEASLTAARDAALNASRAKSGFLANMSHELRTPMNAIIGYSEMLVEDAGDMGLGDAVQDLGRIHSAGLHLLNLINDILDLSKIEAGHMRLHLEDIEIGDVVKQAVDTARPLMTKKNNELVVEIADGIGGMYTDATKLKQTLLNLLSNAAKFTENGTIRMTARAIADDMVEIECADEGIGMSDQQRGRVFESFAQADDSITKKYGGTGLGLTITRHFCEMLGGGIEVESTSGTGSTFTVRLPRRSRHQSVKRTSSRPTSKSDATTPSSGGTVLVVDDDDAVRDIITQTLNKAGFGVVAASNGLDALSLARKIHPIAITLDVVMQGMDGWQVLTELKADPATRAIPVILVTVSRDQELGLALGAAEFVTKPIDREHLVDLVDGYRAGDPDPEVLIVEDDDDLRLLLTRTLEKRGWRTMQAENGKVALEMLAERIPRLVLLDLMMPVMNGFEVLSAIRDDDRWNHLPVIVVTAKELDEAERSILNEQVAKVLQKGAYTRDALLDEVRSLVASSATAHD